MIYLACPYTHDNPAIEAVRANEASLAAAHFIRKGQIVFSPLSHSASILRAAGDRQVGSWETWMTIGLEIMSICNRLIVLSLVGWTESKGVIAEIEHAFEIDVPVTVIRRDNLGFLIPLSRAIAEDLGPGAQLEGIKLDNSISPGSRP